jgi:hypothetical protein
MYMKRIIVVLLLLAPALFAQTSTASAADVQALKDALAAQQQQIQHLTEQLQQLLQNGQQTQAAAADAANKAAEAQAQSSQQQQSVAQLKGDVAELKTSVSNAAPSAPEGAQTPTSGLEGPLTIRFKGLSITPGGFVAAETVRRSKALGGDVSTPFNSLPLPGASQSKESEFYGSARQSRPTVYLLGHLKSAELSGYVSGDFLSAGVTSTSTQTDGYTLRLRQAWGQAQFNNGWSFLGGQMWSLVTENQTGIRPSDDAGKTNDARPRTIDAGYNVGFSYARQFGLRVTKNFGKKLWFAAAIENPEATATLHNNADNFLLGQAGDGKSYNSSGTYSFNPSPDIIAKVAFDPGFGHYEVFALYDRFADRVFPCGDVSAATHCDGSTTAGANVLGAYNSSKNGGGFGANARWNFDHKHIVFGLHGFGGSGVGRYGTGQLSDVTVNANGTLALIRGYQGLSTLEWHGKKLDLYAYGGAEYASRTATEPDPVTGKNVGYGNPLFVNSGCYTETLPGAGTGFTPGTLANCAGDTRALIEGTGGFWYRLYNGPAGRVQFGGQYSYLTRNTWSGVGGAPRSIDGMVLTSFRYYLP